MRARVGTWFDPHVVDCFERAAAEPGFWETLGSQGAVAEAVSALEPPAQGFVVIDEDYLDDIARAFAQVIDAKSPFTSGHSERVAVYADMIAAELRFDAGRRTGAHRE